MEGEKGPRFGKVVITKMSYAMVGLGFVKETWTLTHEEYLDEIKRVFVGSFKVGIVESRKTCDDGYDPISKFDQTRGKAKSLTVCIRWREEMVNEGEGLEKKWLN